MFFCFFHNSTKNFNIVVNCMPFSVVLWLAQSLFFRIKNNAVHIHLLVGFI